MAYLKISSNENEEFQIYRIDLKQEGADLVALYMSKTN